MAEFPHSNLRSTEGVVPPTVPAPARRAMVIPANPGLRWFLSEGWRLMWSDWPGIAGPWVVYCLIVLAGGFVPLVGGLAGIFTAPLAVAAGHLAVRRWRGEPTRLAEMFDLKEKYWPLVGQQLVVALTVSLAFIPVILAIAAAVIIEVTSRRGGGGAGGPATVSIVLVSVSGVVSLFLYAYVFARLSFSGLIYLDAPPGRMQVFEAMSASWRASAAPASTLFGLVIVQSLVLLLTALLLLVGALLIGGPFAMATSAVCFAVLVPRAGSGRYCHACGYDMVHAPTGVCPECGTTMLPPELPV